MSNHYTYREDKPYLKTTPSKLVENTKAFE